MERELEEIADEKPITVVETKEEIKERPRWNLMNLTDIAEALRMINRAMMGLPLEEDHFAGGMMNLKDERERTRISIKGIHRHVYERIVFKVTEDLARTRGGINSFAIFGAVAHEEDIYYIAKDGEQRKETILMKRQEQTPAPQVAIQIPEVQTKTPQKKGVFGRFRRNKEEIPQ